jgi:hypothetical protein
MFAHFYTSYEILCPQGNRCVIRDRVAKVKYLDSVLIHLRANLRAQRLILNNNNIQYFFLSTYFDTEMGRECSTNGGEEECISSIVGKAEGKRPPGRPRSRWVDNTERDLKEVGWDGMGWIWIGTSGGLL